MMVQGPSLETIDAIRNAPSLDSQITALKQLKNDIVGHGQRKEIVVKQGVLEPLVNILSTGSKATGKRRIADTNGASAHAAQQPWTLEDDARLQATLILSSLASGGRAFVQPLIAAEAPQYLLDALAVETTPRLVTATLQVLRNLVVSASTGGDIREQIALGIFERNIDSFHAILRQPSTTSVGKQQLKLAADIITHSANDDSTRAALTAHGLLDSLAALVASYAIANKHFDTRVSTLQLPSPPSPTTLPSILSAITAIIIGSNFRAQSFILSPPIRELLSTIWSETGDHRYPFGSRAASQNPTEHLLPALHVPVYKSVSFNGGSSAFPALASLQPNADRKAGGSLDTTLQNSDPEHANAVVSWLIFLARSLQGMNRLIALRLLALINSSVEADPLPVSPRSEFVQRAKERERQMAMLAIPLAVQLVQTASEGKNTESVSEEVDCQGVREEACDVLALLIESSKELQSAAVDAGAIKRVCPLLKKTFDNVPISKPLWSSRSSTGSEQQDVPPSCRMGSRGLPLEIQHAMRCRESALEALASLANKEDIHRKAIVEAGVVSCIIDSLKPFPADLFVSQTGKQDKITPKDGNTTAVILAACHAAQSMSRSVSLLRTSLIDAGIAKPIFELLKKQAPEVQVAATDVCCNLLLDFSPMREDLLSAGVIKTLTEHARQSEMGLRLASLWALKHLVLNAPKDIKVQCLEELGTGWLVGAIQGEQRGVGSVPTTGGVSIGPSGGLSTPNAAGEQVDLLNPASMDLDDPADDGDDLDQDEDEDGEIMYDEASSTHYQASQLRSTLNPPLPAPAFNTARYLSSVRDMEQNPALQAKRDDVAVQEQALDFVRNMLNGDDCAVMLEHLLEQFGVEKLFGLLADKLAPVLSASSAGRAGNGATGTTSRQIYQPTELIASTVHVISHIANGSPKHKQLLIAQRQLLHNWLPHFNHGDRRVRVICVWAVISLTWVETDSDRSDAQKRARELKNCGIENTIRALANDPDLDVRERVRTAIRHFEAS